MKTIRKVVASLPATMNAALENTSCQKALRPIVVIATMPAISPFMIATKAKLKLLVSNGKFVVFVFKSNAKIDLATNSTEQLLLQLVQLALMPIRP